MAEETTITTSQAGTSVTTDTEPQAKTPMEYVLYKMDRTIAILGVIGIVCVALFKLPADVAMQIASAGVGGLIGYVGARGK